jgi:zinc transport system permease protein
MRMIDPLFLQAILGGCGIALVAAPLGSVMVWRRLAYFGDTLSHSALLGIALSLVTGLFLTAAVFLTAVVVALTLNGLRRMEQVSSDALLGLLSHASLAIGLVVIALIPSARVDLFAFLFGDILSIDQTDLWIIGVGGAAVFAILAVIWRSLLLATLDRALAEAEGVRPGLVEAIYTVLLALVIATAIKLVGALLITALLIIPAVTARSLARTPERMVFLAMLFGIAAVIVGLSASYLIDIPSGPSIVVAAFIGFSVVFFYQLLLRRD